MKHIVFVVGLLILILLAGAFIYLNFIWRGSYYNMDNEIPLGSEHSLVGVSYSNGNISISVGNLSSGKWVSEINAIIENNSVIIGSYEKPYFPLILTREIRTKNFSLEKGTYRIYYKNSDGTLLFIKEININ